MRFTTRLSFIAFVCALLLTAAVVHPAGVRAQSSSTATFDAPWLSFDTGWFARGFEQQGGGPVNMKSADLDKDGDIDLVSTAGSIAAPGFVVLMNTGDGTYALPAIYRLPDDKTQDDLALTDVDKDGDTDVLVTAPDYNGLSNILALFRNNGDGTFAPYELFTTGQGPKGIAVADFNGDGFEDAATANAGVVSSSGRTFSTVLHNGQPGAAAGFLAHTEFTIPEGMTSERIAAADVNGDGRPDLAVCGRNTQTNGAKVALFFNNGAGGFTLAAHLDTYPNSRLTSLALAFADLDKDGDADLLTGGLTTNQTDDRGLIAIRRNAGNGTFGAPEAYSGGFGVPHPQNFGIGDLNGDTYPDVVAVTPQARTMDGWFVILSDGAGGFKTAARYEASQMTLGAQIFDADRDGDADVVTNAGYAHAATVHRNLGDGTFFVLPRIRLGQVSNGPVGGGFTALEAGDLDRDGDTDMVSADAKAWIMRNNGNGSFAEAELYEPPINPGQIKLRDLNGDGHLDLLFGPDRNAPPYHFGSSLNRGDGTFGPGTVTNVNACQAGSIDTADFDGDGDLDVALTEEGACAGGASDRVFIYRNDGRGGFTLATVLTPCNVNGLGIGDFNHDGRLDFMTSGCNAISVFPGKGDLTFGPPIESGQPAPHHIEGMQFYKVADLNNDGRLDLAMILTEYPASTAVIGTALGNGDGTFATPRRYVGASGGSDLILSNTVNTADIDGDGDQDVLVANNAPNDLSLFYNNGDGTLRHHERYGVGASPTRLAAADFDKDGAVDIATGIGMPPLGGLKAVVILRNTRLQGALPHVTFSSPSSFETFYTPSVVRVAPVVTPARGRPVRKVEFYLGDANGLNLKLIRTDTTAPFEAFEIRDQAVGTYNLYAIPYDDLSSPSYGVAYQVKTIPRKLDITGRVTDANGAALAEVDVTLGGDFASHIRTGNTGGFGFLRLTEGESYTLQAYKEGYEFTPPSRSFDPLTDNETVTFVGRPVTYAVGGRITVNGVALAGATVTLSGSRSGLAVTNADGRYTFAELPPGASVTVTPAKDGHTFSPPSASFSSLGANSTADFAASAPTAPARVNHALASGGATPTASSTMDANRLPLAAVNGDRKGQNWGSSPSTGSGWHDATGNAYPDWLEVNFGGVKSVDEVSVFSVQDNVWSPAEPTEAMTFSQYGVTDFTVEFWNEATGAWAPVPGGVVTGNNRVWRRVSFAAVSTPRVRVLIAGAQAGYSRLAEVEAWGAPSAPVHINHALASNGATATASSTIDANRAPLAAINGDRKGQNWGSNPSAGSGWHDATANDYPDWLEVTFAGDRSVSEVHVFSVQDNFTAPSEPTEAMAFTRYGLTDFNVEYWTGSAWTPVPGGIIVSNNKVWAKLSFAPLTTSKIRVVAAGAQAGYSRIAEIEAWGPSASAAASRVNVAAASNGATAAASSTIDANRAPLAAINGDRKGQNWGSNPSTGSGWHDATGNSYPDWLEVTFSGAKTISEVSVFSVQDNFTAPSEPTEAMAFTKYGLTDFDVEYWTGSAWQVVSGGMVVSNSKVWAKVSFAPLQTTKIRVVAKGGLAGYSRIAEVEAY